MAVNLNPSSIIRWLLHPSSKIQQRVAHAAIWSFLSRFGERFIEYGRLIILARLLTPQDFGLMGVGLIAISAMESLTKPGLAEAIIQKKGDVHKYLDVLWTAGLIRSALVGVLLALLSPLIARFFDAPEARMILLAMAGAVLVNGLINSGTVLLQKELEFHKVSVNGIAPIMVATIVSVGFALAFHNVWALVLGYLAKNLATVAISYWVHPYRPRLSRRSDRAKELFTFSRWVYLHRVLNFASSQADSIMLGGTLGTVSLGSYQMAQRTSIMPLREIPRGISQVAFPVYSKIQNDVGNLRKAFLGIVEATTSVSLPLSIILLLLADDIVVYVLGDKWLQAAPVMQILAMAGFINAFAGTGSAMFNGVGKPWVNLQIALVRTLLMVALIFPMTRTLGLDGAAYTVLIGGLAGFFLYLYHSFSILSIGPGAFLKALMPAFISTSAIAGTILGIKWVVEIESLQALIAVVAVAAIVYLAFYSLISWKFKSSLFNQLAPRFMGSKV